MAITQQQTEMAVQPGDWKLAAIRREIWPRDRWLEELFDWIVETRPGTYASAKMAEVWEEELQRSHG